MRTIIMGTTLAACIGLTASACAKSPGSRNASPPPYPACRAGIPGDARQAIIVSPDARGGFHARLEALDAIEDGWKAAFPAVPAVIGRNGFAPADAKREGDGKTPTGCYRLGTAFGQEPAIDTKLPYRMAGARDYWIDDPASPEYNRWVSGARPAVSHERMLRTDGQYRYGIVISYNTDPVVPGRGSAIFAHVWKSPDSPTAGCVALSEADMTALLRWIDPGKKPVIVLGARDIPDRARPAAAPPQGAFTPSPALEEISGPEFITDLRYNTADNFLKRNVYAEFGLAKCYLHRDMAKRLRAAARDLQARGYRIVLWDCYRPVAVQRAMWKIVPDARYVADPAKGSNHNRGIAVDCTIAGSDGRPVPMPTEFDDFTGKAAANAHCGRGHEDRCRNRALLRGAMERAGIEIYPGEWWHFQLPDAGRYPVLREH